LSFFFLDSLPLLDRDFFLDFFSLEGEGGGSSPRLREELLPRSFLGDFFRLEASGDSDEDCVRTMDPGVLCFEYKLILRETAGEAGTKGAETRTGLMDLRELRNSVRRAS